MGWTVQSDGGRPGRSAAWKWWVCGLLLLATMINYMDRVTLNQTSKRIMDDFHLAEPEYGQIESAFAVAFAVGALIAGWMADRWNVRWLFPAAVLAWSLAGVATGFARSFLDLLVCRFFLGLAESANWPCALRTTQRILPAEERGMGNGILQSGASLGAILTPLIVLAFLYWTDSWRYPFVVIGLVGTSWVFFWLAVVKQQDLALPNSNTLGTSWNIKRELVPFIALTQQRRFWVLVLLAVTVNISWHFFRAWLPLFLQKSHGYSETAANGFMSAYYVSTDLGALGAGWLTLRLAGRGFSIHGSRVLVFFCCALLTALSVATALLPSGPLLLGLLLVIGFGALGLFPNYYSLTQELTVEHQGKMTGTLSCITWSAMAVLHPLVGESVKQTGSYSQGMALAGLAPLVGFVGLLFLWRGDQEKSR